MQKHAGNELVEVLLLMLEQVDVEQILVRLRGVLQEVVVATRSEQDVLDYEHQQADCDQQTCQRRQMEVRAHVVLQQLCERVVGFYYATAVYEWDLHAHYWIIHYYLVTLA